MKKAATYSLFITIILIGCAPYSENIAPTYHNREKLTSKLSSCDEIQAELDQTEQSLESLSEQQDRSAWGDMINIILGQAHQALFTVSQEKKIAELKGDKIILQELLNRCR